MSGKSLFASIFFALNSFATLMNVIFLMLSFATQDYAPWGLYVGMYVLVNLVGLLLLGNLEFIRWLNR